MRIVWLVSDDKLDQVKDKLLKDDLIARQSVTIRSARSLDFNNDGSYIYISGSGEAIERAKELVKESVENLEENEVNEVISRIEASEDEVASGLGNIFG
jgi:hypothetical protein